MKLTVLQLTAILAAVIALFSYSVTISKDLPYRTLLEHAGDRPLPGRAAFQDREVVASTIRALVTSDDGAGRTAYIDFLEMDDRLAGMFLLLFASIAWFVRERPMSRAWWRWIAVTGLAYAAADWTENQLLRDLLSNEGDPGRLIYATSAKWLLFYAAALAAAAALLRAAGSWRAWWSAFFQDVPHILDSIFRRTDLLVNRELYDSDGTSSRVKPFWRKPPFLFFCITVVFIGYGPTADGFCTILPNALAPSLPLIAAPVAAALFTLLLASIARPIVDSVQRRSVMLSRTTPDARLIAERTRVAAIILGVAATITIIPLAGGVFIGGFGPRVSAVNACADTGFSALSLARFAACILAIVAFYLATKRWSHTGALIVLQALIAGALCGAIWLLGKDGTEAAGTPYHHVFGLLAPALLAALLLAPVLAWAYFRSVIRGAGPDFAKALKRTELFVPRGVEPDPTFPRVFFALVQGVSYKALQLVLPPALLAFVAPADWVKLLTIYGFVLSLSMATWAHLFNRWGAMSQHLERRFLSGTSLPVSVFVIVIAGLRVFDVGYVTTIIDAAPFGVTFAFVVMSYALSWLMEYWMNRALGVQLLRLLGADPGALSMPYEFTGEQSPNVRVAREHRELSYHGLGRFLVTGPLLDAQATPMTSASTRAFHSYEWRELFEALAPARSAHVARIVRHASVYFYSMNLAIILVFAGFGAAYSHYSRAPQDPVVPSDGTLATGGGLNDLSQALIATGENDRPALIVVASGGGTRAALYTSHVLQGLYQAGAARDIVLTSGVSGGGVALAYFGAYHEQLTASGAARYWDRFRRDISGNIIGDVLEGATETRIFGTAPLSVLLAESIDRHLLKRASNKTLDLPGAPAIILNTTITGHPADDSTLLKRALLPARDDCREVERPYTMVHGGRLIFTNLKQTNSFPHDNDFSDIRLPYVVVADPRIKLANAAALNANFPPVFPNARVQVPAPPGDSACKTRSYFVTDGGALENLGLISALYGVMSALDTLKNDRCAKEKCRLKRIHFVVAEASATQFDYEQDRGVSAGVGGAKERMTGGLTLGLWRDVQNLYAAVDADRKDMRFHYLALPLAFRTRGGLGTHWMQADTFRMNDPRTREPMNGIYSSVDIDKPELDDMWRMLHDKSGRYCDERNYGTRDTDRVRYWICGAPGEHAMSHDWHVDAWRKLLREIRRPLHE